MPRSKKSKAELASSTKPTDEEIQAKEFDEFVKMATGAAAAATGAVDAVKDAATKAMDAVKK